MLNHISIILLLGCAFVQAQRYLVPEISNIYKRGIGLGNSVPPMYDNGDNNDDILSLIKTFKLDVCPTREEFETSERSNDLALKLVTNLRISSCVKNSKFGQEIEQKENVDYQKIVLLYRELLPDSSISQTKLIERLKSSRDVVDDLRKTLKRLEKNDEIEKRQAIKVKEVTTEEPKEKKTTPQPKEDSDEDKDEEKDELDEEPRRRKHSKMDADLAEKLTLDRTKNYDSDLSLQRLPNPGLVQGYPLPMYNRMALY